MTSKNSIFYEVPIKDWHGVNNLSLDDNEKEMIRQWFIHRISTEYQYPLHSISLIGTSKHVFSYDNLYGFSINTQQNQPFTFVFIVDNIENIQLDALLLKLLEDAELFSSLILTDAKTVKIYKRRFDNNQLETISQISKYHRLNETDSEISLLEITKKVENLFFDIHSFIRDIDGFHADDALDELSKLIFTKIYDEKFNNQKLFRRNIYGCLEELGTSIRTIYKQATHKLERNIASNGVFNQNIKLSNACLSKVVEAFEKYSISDTEIDIKGRAFQKVLKPALRAGMGQYFTPDPIVNLMVNISQATPKDVVLDPFSGSGHFLTTHYKILTSSSDVNQNALLKNIHGIEKNERMVRIALTDMVLRNEKYFNVYHTDSLLDFNNYIDYSPESFDLIWTNPPFGSLLGKEVISQLGEFELSVDYKSTPLEILGLERCFQFLRPGGKLLIVLPDSILSNPRYERVREWIENHGKLRCIISLPIETFTPYGANIKTSVLVLRKWDIGEVKTTDYNIKLIQLDNIGYNSSGNITEQSEVDEAIEEITTFLNREGW